MRWPALSALIRKDLRLYFSNPYFTIVTVMGLVLYVAIYFLMPATLDETLALGLYLADLPPALEALLVSEEVYFYRADSVAALQQAVLDGDIPAGYAFPDDLLIRLRQGERVTAHLFLAPETPPEFVGIYEVILHEFAFAITGQELNIETTESVLGPDMAGQQIAPRRRMLPLLTVAVLMVECLGLASLIAAEVESGTLRALLVTPLTVPGLFLSKGLFGTLFAFVQATWLITITGGLTREPLLILTALLLGSALVTGVAFLIASLGRDLMSVMGWGMLALLLLTLPTFSVLLPGTATSWIKLIPSYYLVDTIHRVINLEAGWGEMWPNLLALLAATLALLTVGGYVLKRKFR